MKPQGRRAFNDGCGYSKPHGVHSPKQAAATADAMDAFLAKGGKVTRVEPVKGGEGPGFRNTNFNKRRGKR